MYDISPPQLALIAAIAVLTSVIGGVAGYGAGALMPLVLVPLIGPEPVVPIVAISALFTNASRVVAFAKAIAWRETWLVLAASLPTCALGAWGFTRLTGQGALLVIGTMMVASVPLRRLSKRRGLSLGRAGLAASSAGWGVVVGGTTGAGAILLALLMAAGLEGVAVIATDAAISIAIGLMKVSVFGAAGALDPQVIAVALLIGFAGLPGAFLAKALVARMPLRAHTAILDAVVAIGGAAMILAALRR